MAVPEPLSQHQLDELHRDLSALVTELEHMIGASADGAKPVDLDQPIGRVSRIDAIQQQKMLESNRRSAKLRLRLARAALAAIDTGDYGECRECEEPISFRRLKARPESRLCVDCQGAQERR